LPAAREQDAAKDGLERLRLDVGAGPRGDRLGGRVRLLRSEPALLDREGDRIAGRPDGVGARDPAVRVAEDEAAFVARDAPDGGPDRSRQGDDALRVEPPAARLDAQLPVRRADDDSGSDLDARLVEVVADAASRDGPEEPQRGFLRRVDRDL